MIKFAYVASCLPHTEAPDKPAATQELQTNTAETHCVACVLKVLCCSKCVAMPMLLLLQHVLKLLTASGCPAGTLRPCRGTPVKVMAPHSTNTQWDTGCCGILVVVCTGQLTGS
jgi:hypothetical protein